MRANQTEKYPRWTRFFIAPRLKNLTTVSGSFIAPKIAFIAPGAIKPRLFSRSFLGLSSRLKFNFMI